MKNKNLNKIKYNVLRTGQLSGIYFSLTTLCLSPFGLLAPVLRSLGLCPSVNPLCCKKLHKSATHLAFIFSLNSTWAVLTCTSCSNRTLPVNVALSDNCSLLHMGCTNFGLLLKSQTTFVDEYKDWLAVALYIKKEKGWKKQNILKIQKII